MTIRNDIFFSKIPTYFFQYLFGLLFSYSNLTFISLHYLDFYIHFLLEFFPLSIGNFIPLFYFDLYFFPILTSKYLPFLFWLFSPLLPIIVIPLLFQELCEISDTNEFAIENPSRKKKYVCINIFCISGLQRKFRTICHTKLRLSEAY